MLEQVREPLVHVLKAYAKQTDFKYTCIYDLDL